MKEFKPMVAVYTYPFPETYKILEGIDMLPKRALYLTQTPVEAASRLLEPLFTPALSVPATKNGLVDLDMLHVPIIDRITQIYEKVAPGISEFPYQYPVAGSSEGIFHFLAALKNKGVDKIHSLKGEYEGYKEYGKTLGIATESLEEAAINSRPGFWFISNPSARDGNLINQSFIKELCDNENQVASDLAYLGCTKPQVFDLRHPNIPAVFLSLSKPYGLFRFRTGFVFSRTPIDSLYANKWFKNIPSLLTSLKVVEDVGPEMLHRRYEPVQKSIVKDLERDFGIKLTPSDVLLLAHLPVTEAEGLSRDQKVLIAPFQRGNNFRFCLTPYFEEKENE